MPERNKHNAAVKWPLLASLMLACGPAIAADTYDINVILPLTGGASFLGKAEQKAVEIAQKSINSTGGIHGRPVRFIFGDDQSSPQTAVQLSSQVIAERPVVVLGSSVVALCSAMAPQMQNGPVMYCFSPGVYPGNGSYVFTFNPSTHDLENVLIRYFRLKGWTRIAVITSTDATGQEAEAGIDKALALPENKDVQLVARTHFNPTDLNVAAQIENIKAAQPQALIAWSTGAPIATIFKGIIQGRLTIPVATTNGNMTLAQMTRYAEFLPKELYLPSSAWPVHASDPDHGSSADKAFFTAYREAGETPDAAATYAWDPTMITVDALRHLDPNATAAAVRDYIEHLKGYVGINGVYDFAVLIQDINFLEFWFLGNVNFFNWFFHDEIITQIYRKSSLDKPSFANIFKSKHRF